MFRAIFGLALLMCSYAAQGFYVSMTAPADGASYTAPASFNVAARAEAFEDGVRVVSHKLYRSGSLIASSNGGNVSATVSGLGAGTYVFHSVATTNTGLTQQSAPVEVTVVVPGGFPPTVSLGAPTGAPFIAPATVGFSATAADSDGNITKVQFFANNGLIGTDTAAPYQMSWSNVAAGTHSVVAKATDNNNITTTSSPVSVTVAASVVKGVIDGVYSDGAGGFVVTGWACSTGRDESIRVHGYAGGQAGSGVAFANVLADAPSEPAVAAACYAQGTNYRFRIPLTDAIRQQHSNKTIFLHGIGEGDNLLLQRSGMFTIPAPLSLTRTYTYDAHQRLCKSVEPETGATLYGYDAAGNLAWSAAGLPATTACDIEGDTPAIEARSALREYDAQSRLKELSFPDGRGDQTWEYTPDGLPERIETINVVGANNPFNVYAYNARRLLKGETQELQNWYTNELDYGYDRNGHLKTLQYPGGQVVDFAPNALGQATKAGGYASNATYHPNGSIAGFTYGNGIAYSMSQNDRQLPARTTHGVGIMDFGYTYDPNGNVGSITDYVNGRQNRTMSYDGLDRLESVTSAPMYGIVGGATYSYDGLDNLARVKIGGAAVRDHYYCYDASQRLTNVKTGSCGGSTVIGLGYDVQGNLSNKSGQTFDFDYGNRLREAIGVERYRYDAFGRRILAMNFGSGTLFSQYGQNGQLLYQENTRTGQMKTTDHIYLAGSLIAQREVPIGGSTATVKYLHTDGLGSPVVATSSGGTVTERMEYEPYGDQLVTTASIGQDRPGYTGHVRDEATDLSYMQQRYYDPTIGRFLSVDPVTADSATGSNFNRYWYANNNPYRFTDPDGRAPNQAGTADPSHVYFALRGGSGLQALSDAHGSNANRYFYTEKYGWVDIRHFARAAALVQQGTHPEVVRALGAGNESVQWLLEWGDDYRSGFSPEDLSSNAAGIDFGRGLGKGTELAAAFLKWAKLNRARTDSSPAAERVKLPATDPSSRGGAGRGSDSNSKPDQQKIDVHEVKVYNDCGKICSMELSREARSK